MRVLITGGKGQLGTDAATVFSKQNGMNVVAVGKDEIDVTRFDEFKVQACWIKPDVILYCSAFTDVDLAEREIDTAYAVNAFGARNAAIIANQIGSKICYISTDYVFDGHAIKPYCEYDQTIPNNVYGKSKLAGENLVQSLCPRYFIVRTSWLYGLNGRNFVKTMLELGRKKEVIKVVDDQIGSPTYTVDLANFLLDLVKTDLFGTYHASNTGQCSWYEFARAIFEDASFTTSVEPCSTNDFVRPALRPPYSVMEHLAIRCNNLHDLRPWREALRDFLSQI